MIFSLSQESSNLQIIGAPKTDIFCFFLVPGAVVAPPFLWFEMVLSSLKLKNSVYVLDSTLSKFPVPAITKRWQVGEGWVWVAPRAMSTLSLLETPDFDSLRSYLAIRK